MRLITQIQAAIEAFKQPQLVGEGKHWIIVKNDLNVGQIALIRRSWSLDGNSTFLTVHHIPVEHRETVVNLLL